MKKVCVYTLGCKVNQYESGGIVRKLLEKGYDVTERLERADVYIVNTCAVTTEAERKSRQIVSRCRRLNPDARIAVCGCSSQNAAERYSSFAGLVIGTTGKGSIVEELEESGVLVKPAPERYEDDFITETERVRAYVKVQDGCNCFCSYCIVPYLRGRSRSRESASVLSEMELHGRSVKEIVVTGINLSDYGRGIGSSLAELMSKMKGNDIRIRLGSLECGVIEPGLMDALKTLRNFCPHFHLSLQSGSDGVLRRMNRHYTGEQYLDKVRLIRSYFPDAGITTDIIAGFPGETDAEHAETVEFVRRAQFSDMHVFAYSKRPGTAAAKLAQTDGEVVLRRAEELGRRKKELKERFLCAMIGKPFRLLTEQSEDGYLSGYTENYIRGYLEAGAAAENEIVSVYGVEPFRDGLLMKKC